ncbi:MAG: hypothetical protein EPN47_18205 [Acidobacteria bacterium]|nr:MAG: hypothetical protein EPN47_18205 [Acidobacteriota bacterium]
MGKTVMALESLRGADESSGSDMGGKISVPRGVCHPRDWLASWRRHREPVLLAVITCFFAGTTVIWLVLDRQPPWWDDSFYLAKSLVMFDALMDGGVAGYVKRFFSIIPNRPPLITALPTPFYLIFGRDPSYAFGVNLLFIPVLLGSVYLIGRKFWGSRAGLIAAYLVGTMPLIYGLACWYLVEFSLTALVTLAVLLLIQSQDFRRFRETLCFGIVCAFGLLLKVTFPLFLLFPFLHAFIRFLASSRSANSVGDRPSTSRLKTLSALVVPSLVLALPWYLRNFRNMLHLVEFAGFSPDADTYGTGYVFSFGAVKRYLLELTGSGTSYYYVLLAIVLIALIIGSGKIRSFLQHFGTEPLAILFLWGLPFLVFLFGRNKNLRYVAPLLPAFGLVLAFALDFALRMVRRWQAPMLCIVLVFPAISVFQKSFFVFGDRVPGLNHFLCVDASQDVARKHERAKWPLEDILNSLSLRTTFEPGRKTIVLVGTDRPYFNVDNLELAAVHMKLPFEVTTSAHTADLNDLLRSLNSASFFIYKEGGEPESPYYNTYQKALIREVQRNGRFVELPTHWLLPDGGKVRIFENSTPWWSIVREGFIPSGVEPVPSCEVNFGNQIELTGLSIEQSQRFLRVKYQWLCLEPPGREYWCFTHVLDEKGKIIGFLDHPIVSNQPPMRFWKKGDVAVEEVQFPIPPSQSQKRVRLLLGLYHVPSGQRLPICSFALSRTSHASLADNDTGLLISSVYDHGGSQAEPARLPASH